MQIRQHKIHSAHPKQINPADRLHRLKYMILLYNLFIERLPTQIINIAILGHHFTKSGRFPIPDGLSRNLPLPYLSLSQARPDRRRQTAGEPLE
jgi:hypothetical protein